MTSSAPLLPPSFDEFNALADAAYAGLPDQFREMVGDVVMRVSDWPEPEMLEDLGIDDAYELSGLYQGVDLARRSVLDTGTTPSMVFLFRRPILDEWCALADVPLDVLITHILVHEIGHHFGLSDADMDAIEAQAEAS